MNIELIISIISAFILISIFAFKISKRNYFTYFIVSFVIFSISVDSLNFHCYLNSRNNLLYLNIYDYISILLELLFLITVTNFKKIYWFVTAIVLLTFWLMHAVFNWQNGFEVYSTTLSFIMSMIVCVYSIMATLNILRLESVYFNRFKYRLIAVLGFFVFETSCLIPISTINLELTSEEKSYLAEFYSLVIVIGSIIRNILFSLYFLLDKRIHKNERVSKSLVI